MEFHLPVSWNCDKVKSLHLKWKLSGIFLSGIFTTYHLFSILLITILDLLILYLLAELIYFDTVMKFHHRVTQSFTEFYSFDFKLIKLCETLWNSVLLCGELIHIPAERSEQMFHIRRNLLYNSTFDIPPWSVAVEHQFSPSGKYLQS